MWTLIVNQIVVGSWFFFPLFSTSAYTVSNLSKEYCITLGKEQTKNVSEGDWRTKLEIVTKVQCVEQK